MVLCLPQISHIVGQMKVDIGRGEKDILSHPILYGGTIGITPNVYIPQIYIRIGG